MYIYMYLYRLTPPPSPLRTCPISTTHLCPFSLFWRPTEG